MKIIFIGDIDGKIGRKAVAQVLPEWKKLHEPDLVMANVENIAHGKGITASTLEEVRQAGVDFFTTGNHWATKEDGLALFSDRTWPLIRPANWPGNVPGEGWRVIEVGVTHVAIINLLGQVFIRHNCESPFHVLDKILADLDKRVKIIIVDFQAEATSEKIALAWHADGRASALLGTHTHVPTADGRLLPKGTAYITDVGMAGARDSVIGDRIEERLASFMDQLPRPHEIPEHGEAQVNAVVLDIDAKSGRATKIERLDALVEI